MEWFTLRHSLSRFSVRAPAATSQWNLNPRSLTWWLFIFVELFTDKCFAFNFAPLWMNLHKYAHHRVTLSFQLRDIYWYSIVRTGRLSVMTVIWMSFIMIYAIGRQKCRVCSYVHIQRRSAEASKSSSQSQITLSL